MSNSLGNPTPQFSTAEYATGTGGDRCQFCQQSLGGIYYRVNEARACAGCAEKMRTEIAVDRHAAYVRALAYGIGAAVVGMIGYSLIASLLQGWVISYMSIGVGWLVGTAMMKGSNGLGGRRYQIAAAFLTYAAVSMAAIPIWIHFASEHEQKRQTQQQKLEDEQRELEVGSGQQPSQPARSARSQMSLANVGQWLGRVALVGLASPFIELRGNFFWG